MRNTLGLYLLLSLVIITASGCSPKIGGMVKLVDMNNQPVTREKPKDVVINMINTTAALENASHSVKTDEIGQFISEKDKIVPGTYKIEVSRIGYQTATQTVEVGRFSSRTVEIHLKKIPEGKSRSIKGSNSDEDKIINPGEVNIQAPMM
ncbi:MAG: carboxypeptidase-like regulatory domain-containing protein [Gammaproteobacteria bacterium]|nr:carboxypeptidase-like regulatory domain-containing protein [Gammaproteobacteria bacterium]